MNRKHPILTATRLTANERALVNAAAELEGITVKDLIRSIVLPEVAERVTRSAEELRVTVEGAR
jgi:uncharacterized protein (DUF1778 family)